MIFPVILGNQSKLELLYQEKKFVAGRMSGIEQLGNNSRETRGACKRARKGGMYKFQRC